MAAPPTDTRTIRIGHSPDPDDAFMWYPLANGTIHAAGGQATATAYTPKIDTGRYRFEHVLEDIQSLNDRAERAELEITAVSIHQYPYISDRYVLTSCGSSMGDRYGPMLVAKGGRFGGLDDLLGQARGGGGIKIAIPGLRTTAYLALQLLLRELDAPSLGHDVVMFDRIIPAVAGGEYDAGLIIHEGQLTYAQGGLDCLVDLGRWWTDTRELPLPLGGNAIRRDLGAEVTPICAILMNSIRYALEHREEATGFALQFARDMGADLADRFIGMYVNDWTLDYGPTGRRAVRQLLSEGADAGLVPRVAEIDFASPE